MTSDATTTAPLVVIDRVSKQYLVHDGWRRKRITAVDSVSFLIHRGEMLALVGESGSGKSTLGRICVGLEKPTDGRIVVAGHDISALRRRKMRAFRKRIQIVFQNPYLSLNPRIRVGDALEEVLAVWRIVPPKLYAARIAELLEAVHLPRTHVNKYPHELSGGERQRVAIARAISLDPDFLVADEPVSALDVSVSARILNLLLELRERLEFACLFITHDLHLARVIADRVAVMRLGSIVEAGQPDRIFNSPEHPYTQALVNAQLVIPRPKVDLSVMPSNPARAAPS